MKTFIFIFGFSFIILNGYCNSNMYNDSTLTFGNTLVNTCTQSQEIAYSTLPNYIGHDTKATIKSSITDGRYYEWVIEFKDGFRGLLFQGVKTQNFFIEDPLGLNYYYSDRTSAIRALYIYKKFACISSKERIK